MAMTTVEKLGGALEDALADSRFVSGQFALHVARLPASFQMRFFKIVLIYLEILSAYYNNKIVPMGMKQVCEASDIMIKSIEGYFPAENTNQLTFDGMEWEQV